MDIFDLKDLHEKYSRRQRMALTSKIPEARAKNLVGTSKKILDIYKVLFNMLENKDSSFNKPIIIDKLMPREFKLIFLPHKIKVFINMIFIHVLIRYK
ncbi:MAG: hypothetical protein ACTSWN_05080 [Promethearchaeota archaeon]